MLLFFPSPVMHCKNACGSWLELCICDTKHSQVWDLRQEKNFENQKLDQENLCFQKYLSNVDFSS